MSSMFVLILISFFTGLAAWFAFLWAVKSGHFDDVEGPKYRMLDDDDDKEKGKEMVKDEERDEKKEKNKDRKKNKNKHDRNDGDKEACGS